MARSKAQARKKKSTKAKPSLEKPGQHAKANQVVEIPATIECTICKEMKDREKYSKKQLKKFKDNAHKCIACVNEMQRPKPKQADGKKKAEMPKALAARFQVEKKQKKPCLLTPAEIVQKQKDMRAAALEELEKQEIEDPALKVDDSTPIPSEEVVANFYEIFENELEEREDWSEGPLKKIIDEYPSILNVKHNGQILTEWLCCQDNNAHRRDVLYEFIELGAKVTPKCYDSIVDLEEFIHELECLIMTGIFEVEGSREKKTLDQLAETCSYEEGSYDDPSLINLFFGRAKPGDHFGCGAIPAIFVQKTLKNLPFLEEGVTHAKDGPFAEILNRYLEDFPLDEPETVEKWRKKQKAFYESLFRK
ncbi:predicted protein [Chaetoceros tenuissimus]|uniref:Uncharacterized protein n=1 Tax=Chaetoceros tenuissimus TaxID=426638 RepID=A0AAD3H137_9STRA|nr:predicted protein [Chaetoceros tenuissimus]